MTQRAMEIHRISDLEEAHAPAGYVWWEVDGWRYEWKKGAPYIRVIAGREMQEIKPLESPTKAAAKRAVFRDIKQL